MSLNNFFTYTTLFKRPANSTTPRLNRGMDDRQKNFRLLKRFIPFDFDSKNSSFYGIIGI
jgi:hypothetical protein